MSTPAISDELVHYLAMTGSTAALFGMRQEALTLADALIAARPESSSANIIFASALMASNNAADALKVLEDRVLNTDPENDQARAYLGLAHKMLGRETDMHRELDIVIAAGRDPDAVAFAEKILE